MKKEIRVVDEKRGIIQITTVDERFYAIDSKDITTGLPTYRFIPSVTYITGFYPKGKFFEQWLRNMGNEAEIVKQLAGEKGSKVHQAISFLLEGNAVSMTTQFVSNISGEFEVVTAEEYTAILSFVNWYKATNPVMKSKDRVIVNEEIGYAGTLDFDCEIDGKPYIVDFKISKEIFPSYELQVSAYKHTPGNENKNLAILQLGYCRNKQGYKFTEVDDKFDLFLATYKIFQNETVLKNPRQIDLPLEIKL